MVAVDDEKPLDVPLVFGGCCHSLAMYGGTSESRPPATLKELWLAAAQAAPPHSSARSIVWREAIATGRNCHRAGAPVVKTAPGR